MFGETAFDREERYLEERLARGEIDNAEFHRELNELQRDYRAAAEQSAMDAFDREMERW